MNGTEAAELVMRLRERRPLVQCLTNTVSAQFVANALLAAGAAPAMVDNPEEAAGFAGVADAVLVNLGTPTRAQVEAMHAAAAAAHGLGRPWVLDPVGVGGLPWRTEVAVALLAYRPAAIRGNASEIAGLAAAAGLAASEATGRGVDATGTPEQAARAATALLARADAVAASSAVDHLFGPGRTLLIAGGDPLQTRVTAMGCALGAVSAAMIAVAGDALAGLAAAHALFAVAGAHAATGAGGPGSFAVRFLDALATLPPATIARDASIRTTPCAST